MTKQFSLFLLSISVLLSGCATTEKAAEVCVASDWQQIGLEDGQRGIAASNESSFIKKCSDHNLALDMDAYNQGHTQGVALFCQTDNAFEIGKQGTQYSVDCPAEFEEEYKIGYQFFVVTSNISQIEDALVNSEASITSLESNISSATIQLSSDELSPSEQAALRQNIDSMTGQIENYEQAKDRLEPALHQLRQQLQALNTAYNR